MSRRVTLLGILVLVTSLLGCAQYYWSRPSGSGNDFVRESLECARQAAPNPVVAQYGIVGEEVYRGCLRAKGWVREKQLGPAAGRLVPRDRIVAAGRQALAAVSGRR